MKSSRTTGNTEALWKRQYYVVDDNEFGGEDIYFSKGMTVPGRWVENANQI
jgi:hypothetical protein